MESLIDSMHVSSVEEPTSETNVVIRNPVGRRTKGERNVRLKSIWRRLLEEQGLEK